MAVRRVLLLFILSASFSALVWTKQNGQDNLIGVVVSENGAPVGGVKIFAWHDAVTNAEGRFDLPNMPSKDSVIYFQKEGFRPKASVLKVGVRTLKIVLEDDSKTAWLILACTQSDSKTSPAGQQLKFLLPKNVQTRKVTDIDYQEYLVSFMKETAPLQLWWGPLVQPGQMVDDLILRSTNFEERSVRDKSSVTIGYDRWGRTADGKAWRVAGFGGLNGAAIYEGVSKELATAYDGIIESACKLDRTHWTESRRALSP